MPMIRNERTGTEELLRDGRFHYAALLADPDTAHLAPPVKTKLDSLTQAHSTTEAADLVRIEKQALAVRAEYVHDQKHSVVELLVLGVVKRKRELPPYRDVYPDGLTGLTGLSGAEQERAVGDMVDELAIHHPEIHLKYSKELLKLAADATAAEKAHTDAEAKVNRTFAQEQSARSELSLLLRKNEGALISLFPHDHTLTRLYYRPRPKKRAAAKAPLSPHASAPTPQPAQP